MQQLASHDIQYDPEFFDEETLRVVLESEVPYVVEAESFEAAAEPSAADPRAAFEQQWNRVLQDPDLGPALRAQGIDSAGAFAKYQAQLSQPADDHGVQSVGSAVSVTQDGSGAITHSINGREVLRVGASAASAAQSAKVLMIVQGAVVVVDGVLLILCALGVKLAMSKAATQKTLSVIIRGNEKIIVGSVAQFEAIEKQADMAAKLFRLARMLRSWPTIEDVLKVMVENMSWWEVALTVVNFLATLAMLFLSGGASLAARIATLALATVVLVSDVGLFVKDYANYKTASGSS